MTRWLLPAVLAGGSTAVAVEPVVREVDLAVESLPTDVSYTLRTGSAGRSGSDAFADPLGVRLGLRWSTGQPGSDWAWLLGADAQTESATLSTSGSWSARSAAVCGGLAWQYDDHWSISGEALAGLGQAALATSGSGYGSRDFTGSQQVMGARVQVRWLPTRSWVVFVSGGWRRDSADLAGEDATLSLVRQGMVVGLGLAWRWAYEPPNLE
jgi:hypothetical protein